MKKWILTGLVGIAVVAARADFPLQWKGGPGWEPEGAYCRLYDPKTVVRLVGTVQSVEKVIPMKGMGEGVHLILVTNHETVPVQLGPTWYVEKQPVQILAKDAIEVTGSRVTCDGKEVIMAAFIKKGSKILKYRDPKGFPKWTIWRP